ncbi:hypothetical protein RJ639_018223 [Escallonia herrerae]|uniref:valine--tRNA ligase n=1 Tax=Escallonia herrerae TaxID=1293975 RepID=A0AA88V6E3_9ASTE|nr:hypothetical protein RJ639_018223 [Escallonia herrerae]
MRDTNNDRSGVGGTKVDVGNRPVTGLRLYLEGKRNNRLAIHCSTFPPCRKASNFKTNQTETPLNTSIISKVLLQLKSSPDAKLALGFFHWSAHHKQTKHEPSSYCIAVHILVKAKLIKDARALLEAILTRAATESSSVFSVVETLVSSYAVTESTHFVFDLLVQTCAKLRLIDGVMDVVYYLDERGFKLGVISYNTLIHVVEKSGQPGLVWRVYEHMVENRTYPNEVTVRIMVNALCKEGKLQKFVDIVDRMHGKRCSPWVIVNTYLIFGMVEEGRIEDGLVLLKRVLQKNMIPDTVAYSLVVYARLKLGDVESAWKVFDGMLKRGFNANCFLYTLFIGVYCEEGKIEEANVLMLEMENGGLKVYDETFNHLIVGCSKVGRVEESLKFFEKMIDVGLVPSCLAFNELVEGLCENGDVKLADEILTLLLDKEFVPDETTYCHLISGYGKKCSFEGVMKLYHEMEYKSLSGSYLILNSLIISLCHCGRLEEAERYLRVMKDQSLSPSGSVYKTLIASYFEKGDKTRADQLYSELVGQGLDLRSCFHAGLFFPNQIIEPLVSKQRFVTMESLAEKALKAIYKHWLSNIKDWGISRQLLWGHRIPVWYIVGKDYEEDYIVARSTEEALDKSRQKYGKNVEIYQDPDVLDTLFSSALWPFSTLGWLDVSTEDFKRFYPTTMLETGYIYIEASKARLNHSEGHSVASVAQAVLLYVFQNILKVLHPFMPFVTEELWQVSPDFAEAVQSTLPDFAAVVLFRKDWT